MIFLSESGVATFLSTDTQQQSVPVACVFYFFGPKHLSSNFHRMREIAQRCGIVTPPCCCPGLLTWCHLPLRRAQQHKPFQLFGQTVTVTELQSGGDTRDPSGPNGPACSHRSIRRSERWLATWRALQKLRQSLACRAATLRQPLLWHRKHFWTLHCPTHCWRPRRSK